jgi:NhaA family Na+:H+ antiporter
MISGSRKNFMRWFSVAGMLSVPALLLAAVASGTGLAPWYALARESTLVLSLGESGLGRPLLSWAVLALMSAVIFVAALECRRAFAEEELCGPDRLRLPALAAIGGMFAAGAAHAFLSTGPADRESWWVASMGTDMALGLAILSLLGERVPGALKSFFASMALFSMLGAALVLAGVHGSLPPWPVLAVAGACGSTLAGLRLAGVSLVSPYLLGGMVLWAALAGGGFLAVLAGPVTALFVPGRDRVGNSSPLLELEQDMLPTVCCVALPLLVFALAGFSPGEPAGEPVGVSMREAVPAFLGMLPARVAGIFGVCWAGMKLGVCSLPPGVGWKEFGGAALLGGAGFTVNVFLGLALAGQDGPPVNEIRLAAAASSAISMAAGYGLLRHALARRRNKAAQR